LARKTDVNAQDTVNGEFPLHKGTLNPSVRLLIVKLLLEHGATVNMQTFKGDTALHYAVRMNRKDLVFELLGANADINLKNKEDKTPFDLAIEDNCSEQITKRLSDTQGKMLYKRSLTHIRNDNVV
jgi:ankyrin repeat protein